MGLRHPGAWAILFHSGAWRSRREIVTIKAFTTPDPIDLPSLPALFREGETLATGGEA